MSLKNAVVFWTLALFLLTFELISSIEYHVISKKIFPIFNSLSRSVTNTISGRIFRNISFFISCLGVYCTYICFIYFSRRLKFGKRIIVIVCLIGLAFCGIISSVSLAIFMFLTRNSNADIVFAAHSIYFVSQIGFHCFVTRMSFERRKLYKRISHYVDYVLILCVSITLIFHFFTFYTTNNDLVYNVFSIFEFLSLVLIFIKYLLAGFSVLGANMYNSHRIRHHEPKFV